MKIYLAGKMAGSTWRSGIMPDYKNMSREAVKYFHANQEWPIYEKAIFGRHDFIGPYNADYDSRGTHGAGNHRGDLMAGEIVALCMEAVNKADLVFAWIDAPDAYGTLFELAYAKGLGKQVYIGNQDKYPDLWFVYEATAWSFGKGMWDYAPEDWSYLPKGWELTPKEALHRCLESPEMLRAMPYKEYLNTVHWKHTRDHALWRATNACQVCNSKNALNVHHRTYERRGKELPEDVIVLCRRCHNLFHENGKLVDPRSWGK